MAHARNILPWTATYPIEEEVRGQRNFYFHLFSIIIIEIIDQFQWTFPMKFSCMEGGGARHTKYAAVDNGGEGAFPTGMGGGLKSFIFSNCRIIWPISIEFFLWSSILISDLFYFSDQRNGRRPLAYILKMRYFCKVIRDYTWLLSPLHDILE